MLNSVLKDAIKKRDETLSILKGPNILEILLMGYFDITKSTISS